MTVRDALTAHYRRVGLLDAGESLERRLTDRWVRATVGGRRIPIKPLLGHQHAFALHDLHHLLTGCGTTFGEELDLAAWELGSGGCGRWVLFWLNRFNAVLIGLVLRPAAIRRGWRDGRAARNLYGWPLPSLLDLEIDRVRDYALTGGPLP